ncbi:MAG: amidase, partial [Mesorhizobium sp.]
FLETYAESDALDLAALVKCGEVAPAELVEVAIIMIERLNPALNAVIHRLYDMARVATEMVDRDAPFAGVPFLLKELASSWTG